MINPTADFPRKFLRKWSSQRDKYYQMQGLIGPRAEPSTRNAISAAAALSYDAVLVLEAAFNSLMQVGLQQRRCLLREARMSLNAYLRLLARFGPEVGEDGA